MTRCMLDYQAAVEAAEVVSFDVFDTLIHRVAFQPKDVFELLSLKLSQEKVARRIPGLIANFASLRTSSEEVARQKLHEQIGSSEVTLQEIYGVLAQTMGLTPEIASNLIANEIALEEALVYANPLMHSLFDYANTIGKRVILCSDMYLPPDTIEGLLLRCGYKPPFELYVSGELRKSKHEGSMFTHLLKELGISQDQMVHFGDNQHADVFTPKRHGIKAHHWPHIEEQFKSDFRFSVDKSSKRSGPMSMTQGMIQRHLVEAGHYKDFWFDIGFQVFGPLFLGKFLWFLFQMKTYKPDKVLFFARDAHIHHRLYLEHSRAFGIHAPCEYAYFSRASLQIPSLTEFRVDRLWYLYSGKAGRSVGAHLRRLGVDPCHVRRELSRAGYSSEDDLVTNGCPQMFTLLKLIYPKLLLASTQRRENIRRYIHQLTSEAKKIALLDIGWVGNMQAGFSRLLQLDRNDVEVSGYYYGTFEHVALNLMPRNRFFTYLLDRSQPEEWRNALLRGGVELLEFAQMAPHGTTLSYREIDGIIHPVMEENIEDREMQGLSFRVQEGAEAFIKRIMPFVHEIGLDPLVSVDWAAPFLRLVTHPTEEEASFLGDIFHSDAPTSTDVRLQLAAKLQQDSRKIGINTYLEAYQKSYWKSGFQLRNPPPRGLRLD